MRIKFWSGSSKVCRLYYYTASTCDCQGCFGFKKYETIPLDGEIVVAGGAFLKNGTFGYLRFDKVGDHYIFDVCPNLVLCLGIGQASGPLKMNSAILETAASLECGGRVIIANKADDFSVSFGPVSGKSVARELVEAIIIIKEQQEVIDRLNKRVHSNDRDNSSIQTANNFISMLANFENLAFKTDSDFNLERELGLDRRETVIELSTRGTVHSDNWYLGLPEQAMARSYHPLDYG
ncbi:MAG: hypothetical protein BYD32DRAFT_449371 [Podila humilis]|nr:MAG: hypothetical protein BYD32DRAFT_449371 [Podila humilis]